MLLINNNDLVPLRDRRFTSESKPLLTVFCWVYNDINYIKRCVEGIINQKTSFCVEIILHDDASTDGTQDLIKKYECAYPGLFKNILNKENQWSLGNSVVQPMFENPRGKYISLLHGDDYWTDNLKLEKQVFFLESNINFSMCFHKISYREGDFELGSYYKPPPKDVLSARHVIRRHYIATSSLVFRRSRINLSKKFYSKVHLNDIYMEILLSFTGLTYYFNEEMGVYNKNSSSISNDREYLKNGRNQLILIYSELFVIAPYRFKVNILLKLVYNYLGKIKDYLKN